MAHAGGRPTIYTVALGELICDRISDGESLKKITDEEGMPDRKSVHTWLIKDEEFLHKYEAARDLQADVYADEMDDIAHDAKLDVQRARLIIDTRKWTAAKLKPKKYGDKLDIKSEGEITHKWGEATDDELDRAIKARQDRLSGIDS